MIDWLFHALSRLGRWSDDRRDARYRAAKLRAFPAGCRVVVTGECCTDGDGITGALGTVTDFIGDYHVKLDVPLTFSDGTPRTVDAVFCAKGIRLLSISFP